MGATEVEVDLDLLDKMDLMRLAIEEEADMVE